MCFYLMITYCSLYNQIKKIPCMTFYFVFKNAKTENWLLDIRMYFYPSKPHFNLVFIYLSFVHALFQETTSFHF